MDSLENARCEYIQRLEEQLEEANNIIAKADWYCDEELQRRCMFSQYLMKYDIEKLEK